MSASISFKEAAQTETATETQIVPASEGKELALQQSKALTFENGSDVEGEYTRDDLSIPYLSLVQKSSKSEMIKAFGMGSFVFNKEVKLSDGSAPFEITPMRMKRTYVQNLEFGSDELPIEFNTAEEVIKNGGHFRYDKNNPKDPNRFNDKLRLQVAVRKPDSVTGELADLFPYSFGDYQWALALWTLQGSGFTSVGKTIIEHRTRLLKEGLVFGRYNVTAEERSNEKMDWFAPIAKFAGKHDKETAEFLASLI